MRNLLPFLLFLACPLMMVFMMRGMHGGHGGGRDQGQTPQAQSGDQRIAQLEREVAQLRDRKGEQSEGRPTPLP